MWVEKFYLKSGNMSRTAKTPTKIPQGVEVKFDKGIVSVKGPKGELKRHFRSEISVSLEEGVAKVNLEKDSKFSRKLWGTYASHLKNMIKGVVDGYSKRLAVEGVGYRAEMQGNKLVLKVGFSHPIEVEIPKELKVEVKDNKITIEGFDKELVGSFAAKIRAIKKPEPYKGKGIRYEDEVVRRKQGKKAGTE